MFEKYDRIYLVLITVTMEEHFRKHENYSL